MEDKKIKGKERERNQKKRKEKGNEIGTEGKTKEKR